MTVYNGTTGDDSFTGSSAADIFNMADGGSDTVVGGGGLDKFYFGASFDATDQIVGGGSGTVYLDGDYSAGLDIAASNMKGVADLILAEGHGYHLTFANGVVAAATTMQVFAPGGAYLDASGDAIGGNYEVYFSGGGATFIGGAGVDTVHLARSQDARGDHLVGGQGQDVLYLSSGNYNLTAGQVADFDRFLLEYHIDKPTRFKFKLGDEVVGQGDTLYVGVFDQRLSVRFDGHRETDGAFHFDDCQNSKLIGGANDDYFGWGDGNTVEGGEGADTIAGAAVFIYRTVWDSPADGRDEIYLTGSERIDLHHVDADTTRRGNQAFHLVSGFSHNPGELMIQSTGSRTATILGDVNGDGRADFAIDVVGDDPSHYNNFIL